MRVLHLKSAPGRICDMLIKGISVISAIAALAAYVFAYRLYFVPLTFIACFLILLLAWALSCVICTMFVDKDKPCKKNVVI